MKRAAFNAAVPIGRRWSECKFEKKAPPLHLRLLYHLAYLTVFKPLKDRLGFSCIRSATTGGAALGPDTFKFFHALGISLKQIYGQTEISGISCVHKNEDINPDTMGQPIPRYGGEDLRNRGDPLPGAPPSSPATTSSPGRRPVPSSTAGSIRVMRATSRPRDTSWSSTGSRTS